MIILGNGIQSHSHSGNLKLFFNRGFAKIDENALEAKKERRNAYFAKILHLNSLLLI